MTRRTCSRVCDNDEYPVQYHIHECIYYHSWHTSCPACSDYNAKSASTQPKSFIIVRKPHISSKCFVSPSIVRYVWYRLRSCPKERRCQGLVFLLKNDLGDNRCTEKSSGSFYVLLTASSEGQDPYAENWICLVS